MNIKLGFLIVALVLLSVEKYECRTTTTKEPKTTKPPQSMHDNDAENAVSTMNFINFIYFLNQVESATILKVADGDTITIKKKDGSIDKVRFQCIDAVINFMLEELFFSIQIFLSL